MRKEETTSSSSCSSESSMCWKSMCCSKMMCCVVKKIVCFAIIIGFAMCLHKAHMAKTISKMHPYNQCMAVVLIKEKHSKGKDEGYKAGVEFADRICHHLSSHSSK